MAAALGAEVFDHSATALGPITRYATRVEQFRRLPAHGTVTVGASEWSRLEALATALADGPFTPSPSQIGNALLHLALSATEPANLLESLRRELETHAVGQAG